MLQVVQLAMDELQCRTRFGAERGRKGTCCSNAAATSSPPLGINLTSFLSIFGAGLIDVDAIDGTGLARNVARNALSC